MPYSLISAQQYMAISGQQYNTADIAFALNTAQQQPFSRLSL